MMHSIELYLHTYIHTVLHNVGKSVLLNCLITKLELELKLTLAKFRDFASVNFNSSSNFVIEHYRRTDFPTLLLRSLLVEHFYQQLHHGVKASKFRDFASVNFTYCTSIELIFT